MKQIRQTLFLLILLPSLAFGQGKNVKIGISLTPAFYSIKTWTGFDHQYSPKFSFTGGFDVYFFASKRFAISSGLQYSSIGYKVDYAYTFLHNNDPLIPRSGDIRAGYLDIPVVFSFDFISTEKAAVYLSGGAISSMLILSNDRTTFEDNTVRDSGFLNPFIMSVRLGAGFRYNVNEKITLKAEPQFRYFFKGIDEMMDQHPVSVNASLGIIFNL
ncbi:MAG: hypothetical protein CVU11_15170 [Bacteroidetes bacterium HGW-Bacteroidetes-6]|jgi:hypothetical protein|nr:MAG: hypothetical protein CVU11_15170 [Bacteroidetes bacterium HGW-Bacteroidetes-6]